MIFSYAPYHEKVEMNNQEIGIRSFFHDCAESPKTGVFPLHWHDCLEIIAVETGWLDVEIDQVTYRVKAEDVAVINPEQLHACVKFCPTATLYCLIVDLNIFRSRYVDTTEERFILPLAKKQLLLPSLVSGNQELRQRIIQCCAVCEAQSPAYQLHAKAIALEILYILFAKCGEIRTGTHLEGRESVSYERVDKILRYVDAHYGERIKLDDFAELLHINKYYICRIFRQHTGKTLSDYINLVRIQKATELLISTSQSITEIAFVTGFQDINFFSRMFKRIMGISPTELRKRHRQKMQPASPQMAETYKEE